MSGFDEVPRESPGDHEAGGKVDRLVRSYLEFETQHTDASRVVARVQAQLPLSAAVTADLRELSPAGSRAKPHQGTRWLTWVGLTAAAAVVAFFGGRYFGPVSASADSLLRDLQNVHSSNVDLCYRVQYAPDPRFWDGKNRLDGPSESVMWTRGDRFWSDCAIGEIKLRIGCEEDGTLWVSSSRKQGIRFADRNSELPQEVALICAVNSMTVPSLVDDVLADFDLQAPEPAHSRVNSTSLVWARLKPGRSHPLLTAALLEIDTQSNVLVRLVLWMVRDGKPRGTVTYTLLESGRQSDDQYRLKSHLDSDAEIEVHRFQEPQVKASAVREPSHLSAETEL